MTPASAKAAAKRVYDSLELFAMLAKVQPDPLKDICSHKEGCIKASHPITVTGASLDAAWQGLHDGYFQKGGKSKDR